MSQAPNVSARAAELFAELMNANHRRTSRLFAVLMVAQWVFAVLVAVFWSPWGWEGRAQSVHLHVYTAVFLGAALSSLPLWLTLTRPESVLTQYVVAVSQMLWGALLIHLTGGRIETHFHVFASLAFVAFYRNWKALIVASGVVVVDHLLRGLLWAESVYGVANPEWWRFLEHAFWVVCEDVVLILACLRGVAETHLVADRQAEAEALSVQERERARELIEANASKERLAKLAEVGQLAASVGHELRNPLAAVRNGLAFVSKRVLDPGASPQSLAADPRLQRFLELMDRELQTSSRIISDLLDFARERPPVLQPCPLSPLIDEAVSMIPRRPEVQVTNEVPATLPIPLLDKEQMRQALMNLIQNAVEAIPPERKGEVRIRAEGGGATPLRITVSDDGVGIPAEVIPKIFLPLFTTKTKGTGLGLAIVAGMVQRHGGTIHVTSGNGQGSTFHVELPTPAAEARATA